MRAVVFANGELKLAGIGSGYFQPDDMIIAADGGAKNCQSLGLIPDVLIGDFDSLSSDQVAAYEAAGTKVIQYPARKDYTDLELALQYAADQDIHHILILGALGDRWDQTLANLLLPAAFAPRHIEMCLVDGLQEIRLIQTGQTLDLTGTPGETLSLIPVGGDAEGITTQGLEYPLNRETLHFGATRGISNSLLDHQASISLEKGLLLCILIRTSA